MGREIERKFLLKNDKWRAEAGEAVSFRQGYLSTVKERTVRVRTRGGQGYLTIKGITRGVSRVEYEYEIPAAEADEMLSELCEKPLIEKNRYCVKREGLTFEIDEFFGDNQGLVLAEVELESEDQSFTVPDWLGEEVSADPRYFNSNLTKHPFREWK